MKTHIDNTIPKEWVSDWMVDDGNDKLLWNDKAPTPNQVIKFIEENYVSKAQSKRYADERVRAFVNWIYDDEQAGYFEDEDLPFEPVLEAAAEEFINQNTESEEIK